MATIKCISEEDLEALLQDEELLTAEVFTPVTSGTFVKMATYSKINTVCSNTFSDSNGNEYSVTFNPDSNDTSQDSTSLAAGSPTITATLLGGEETEAVLLYRMTFTDGNTYYYYSDGSYSSSQGGSSVGNVGYNLNSYLSTEDWVSNTTLETVYVYNNTTVSLGNYDSSSGLTSTDSGSGLFNGCTNLTSADLTYLNISNIGEFGKDKTYTDTLSYCTAFDNCTKLTDLTLKGIIFANSSQGIDLYFGDSPLSYDSVNSLFNNASTEDNTGNSKIYYRSNIVFSATTGEYFSACEIWNWCNTYDVSIYIGSKDGPDTSSSDNHIQDYAGKVDLSTTYATEYAVWRQGDTLYTFSDTYGDYDGFMEQGNYAVVSDLSGITSEVLTFYHNVIIYDGEGLLQDNSYITYVDMSGAFLCQTYDQFYSVTEISANDLAFDFSTSLAYAFANCPNLEYIDLCTWDTSNTTSTSYMFLNCTSLKTIRFAYNANSSSWDTSNVTDMQYMFSGCSSLVEVTCPDDGLDVSNIDMSNSGMFDGCSSLTTIKLKGVHTTSGSLSFIDIPLNADSIDFLLNNISTVEDEPEIIFNTLNEANVSSSAISNAESKGWIVSFTDE